MIMQCKITLIPLTIFYVCSSIIVISRILNNASFMKFYIQGAFENSNEYEVGLKTGMVSNYFNMIMGFF